MPPLPARMRPAPLAALPLAVVVLSFALVAAVPPAVRVFSLDGLRSFYDSIGYTRDALAADGAPVPRLYLLDIPAGWAEGADPDTRKSAFFRMLLPLVLRANEEVAHERARLVALRDRIALGVPLSRGEAAWLRDLARRYEVRPPAGEPDAVPGPAQIATLLRRVDTVPPSLALAQGAIESAYGTSRFASTGNAIYGEWRYGDGLVPRDQREGLGDYRIASFARPIDAVRAYMANLNTHRAYRAFRIARAVERRAGRPPAGTALAATLTAYSERGAEYVALVGEIIAANRLAALDRASLGAGPSRRLAWGLF